MKNKHCKRRNNVFQNQIKELVAVGDANQGKMNEIH